MRLGEAKPQTRGEHSRLEDLVDVVKLPNNKWVQLRILPGDILSYKQHWINIMTTKTKREVRIPKLCLAYKSDTETSDQECPYCDVESQGGVNYLVNVIVRSFQDDEPGKIRVTKAEQASGFKDPNSESWTPVRVLRLTAGLTKKIQELKALNKVKSKTGVKTFDVDHEKFGVDLNIKYDENAKGPEKYQINMAERTPLTEAELGYLQFELNDEIVTHMGLESLAEAKKELGRMQIVGAEEFDGDDDDDALGKKKPAGKKKAAQFDDDDDGDDDDAPPPKRGAKKPAAKPAAKKKPVDDEDDDDDFDDDDDGDDDDAPPPKRGAKKPAAKPAGKKKPAVEDDDDEDDDDFDDDDDGDDDDAPPPKRGAKKPAPAAAKKPAGKKKPADDEDDGDDFDDDDDGDDDDAPPPKRGAKKPAPAAAKKPVGKKKPAVEDDDDDDDDEDDAPPKRGAKKPAAKPAAKKPVGKKKPVVEDDDDDDDDDDGDDDDDDDGDEPF